MAAINPKSSGLSELWSRLRFVLLALIIYRIGTHIPVPGIDPVKISSLFDQNQGTLLGLFNMFSIPRIRATSSTFSRAFALGIPWLSSG